MEDVDWEERRRLGDTLTNFMLVDDDCNLPECAWSPNNGDIIHGEVCEGDAALWMSFTGRNWNTFNDDRDYFVQEQISQLT
eukprot:UN21784